MYICCSQIRDEYSAAQHLSAPSAATKATQLDAVPAGAPAATSAGNVQAQNLESKTPVSKLIDTISVQDRYSWLQTAHTAFESCSSARDLMCPAGKRQQLEPAQVVQRNSLLLWCHMLLVVQVVLQGPPVSVLSWRY